METISHTAQMVTLIAVLAVFAVLFIWIAKENKKLKRN